MRAYEGCYNDREWDEASIGASFCHILQKNTDEAPLEMLLGSILQNCSLRFLMTRELTFEDQSCRPNSYHQCMSDSYGHCFTLDLVASFDFRVQDDYIDFFFFRCKWDMDDISYCLDEMRCLFVVGVVCGSSCYKSCVMLEFVSTSSS
jgi:hypothetical protein